MLGLFNGDSLLLLVTNGIATLVTFVLQVAFLVAALTVVKRHRPDAVFLLAAAPVINICASIFSMVGYAVGGRLVGSSGFGAVGTFYAAMHVATTLAYSASALCLLLGIVRLARPARDDRDALMPARY